MMQKTCTKCLTPQDLDQFPIHKNYKGGRTTWCRTCLKDQSIAWHKNNKDRSREIQRNSYRKNPDVRRDAKFRQRYGITLDEYNKMSKDQNDSCAICDKHKSDNKNNRLFVDHCHITKRVRGLLCDDCNKALGSFKDNEHLLSNAADYIRKFKKIKLA